VEKAAFDRDEPVGFSVFQVASGSNSDGFKMRDIDVSDSPSCTSHSANDYNHQVLSTSGFSFA